MIFGTVPPAIDIQRAVRQWCGPEGKGAARALVETKAKRTRMNVRCPGGSNSGIALADALPSLKGMAAPKREKKVDYEALNSAFMRIPRMKIDVARHLLDLGLTQIYELAGRAPESLLSEIQARAASPRPDVIAYLRMAVYFAENQPPDTRKLYPTEWM